MAKRAIKPVMDLFTPITSEADWEAKGWSKELEPLPPRLTRSDNLNYPRSR